MIVNMDGSSYEERLNSLKLWSLEERRNRLDLIEVFNMSKGRPMTNVKCLLSKRAQESIHLN